MLRYGGAVILTMQREEVILLAGSKDISNLATSPFDKRVCEFLNDLSSELRSDKEAVAYSDVMTFAFWCRRASVDRLKTEFENDEKFRLGLGLAFHITPSNIPVNFAFSFVFGLLAGNSNIVRLPFKTTEQDKIVCSAIKRLFSKSAYVDLRKMVALIRYEQNDEITGEFSKKCNARIIWGGDATIKSVRRLPVPERCVELSFPDRYSFCVINAEAVLKLDELELSQLAKHFYNDTYLVDQNACSSPHLIIWLGEDKEAAQVQFWKEVYLIAKKKYDLPAIKAIDKYTHLMQDAIELNGEKIFKKNGNQVYRIKMKKLPEDIHAMRGRFGYFYEYDTGDINDVAHIVNSKYQTLTYFGVDKILLRDFVLKNHLLGVDRIVPIGKALDINVIWDGYDVVKTLTRIIDVN
jgi:hypothetical protein